MAVGRGETEAGGAQKPAEPMQVAGNLIDGAMEDLEPWNLEAGGDAFQPGAVAHTGRGALVARPLTEGATSSGYALARRKEALTVTGGDALVVRGFVRATGGARGAVRVWLHGTDDAAPSLRSGTALSAAAGWTECSAEVPVPAGCTRATVEILAWFDGADGEVWVDDVALTKGAAAKAIESRTDAGAALVGCPGSAAVRSISAAEPFVVRRIGPLVGSGSSARDRVVQFSDLGASLSGQAEGDRITVTVDPGEADGLRLWLPGGAAAQPLVEAAGGFAAVEDRSSFRAQRLLLGAGPTRCELSFDEPQAISVSSDGELDSLSIQGVFGFELAVGFQQQRQRAQSLLGEARAAWNDGRPGVGLGGARPPGGRGAPRYRSARAGPDVARRDVRRGARAVGCDGCRPAGRGVLPHRGWLPARARRSSGSRRPLRTGRAARHAARRGGCARGPSRRWRGLPPSAPRTIAIDWLGC